MKFELFVAGRYLRARRKEAVISIITAISILGVASGVMALIIALAINTGFRNTLQRNLLGATAHVNIIEKEPGPGIPNWHELQTKFAGIPHVIATAPVLYGQVFLVGPFPGKGVILKGIDVPSELRVSDTLRHLKSGSLDKLNGSGSLPGIVLGAKLALEIGVSLNSIITALSPHGTLTPLGERPGQQRFRVIGIFESGFYDFDDNWAYSSLPAVQKLLAIDDVVNSVELKLDDLYLAPEIGHQAEKLAGPLYASTNWQEQNKQLLNALRMEKAVTVVTIGLIEMIAGLNILITLVMMVMEKYRDIAVLMSMGARQSQIRGIFIAQGALIGVVGTVIGLSVGYTLCYFADKYRWIRLDEQVYALSFVPFEPRATDGLWIAAAAIIVSLLATVYPARNATRITPAEVLRYE